MILKELSIGYTSSAPVVSAIEAEFACGQFICLLGRNGSGKSTLLRTLAGLQKPLSGSISLSNPPSTLHITHSTFHSTHYSFHTTLVTPHCPDLQHTTVSELVAYGRLPHTGIFGKLSAIDHQAADEAIEKVGIKALSDRLIHTLSDGERQKALLARALAQGSPTLLLDEPSAFLDYPSRRQLMQLLVALAHDEGKAILLSTHDVELATQYADWLWVIHDHSLFQKSPKEFNPEEL